MQEFEILDNIRQEQPVLPKYPDSTPRNFLLLPYSYLTDDTDFDDNDDIDDSDDDDLNTELIEKMQRFCDSLPNLFQFQQLGLGLWDRRNTLYKRYSHKKLQKFGMNDWKGWLRGYGSNNKYFFFVGLRATSQSISYEIPLTLYMAIYKSNISKGSIDISSQREGHIPFWSHNIHVEQ
ncbi:hypothetical protein Scep_004550 [Stephania cephalantha]|uniref:Uncharacterized protein n=1 Tax=Stephania cephalantha TaxID=152367 RepID=A0AAP0PZ76_9MAGN